MSTPVRRRAGAAVACAALAAVTYTPASSTAAPVPTGAVTAATPSATSADVPVSRYAGPDRYATSARVSAATFAAGVPVAYVATGSTFPDALSSAPAGGVKGGPVLLVKRTAIPSSVAAELARLKPQRIVVLGGTTSVSDGVRSTLGRYTRGSVSRLAGADRYATSAKVSAATFAPGVPVAYVATGTTFPDALSQRTGRRAPRAVRSCSSARRPSPRRWPPSSGA